MPTPNLALYASVGPDLTHYEVDVVTCLLTRRATVSCPANVQYVWPHASRRFLYSASSDSASGMGRAGTNHHVTAFRIDPATGALSQHGQPIPLPHRPIHMATDIPSEHILVAFNNPPAVRIYKINPDGTPGAEVAQPPSVDPGIFPHQVLATPDNQMVILVARGHDAAKDKPEEPGSLKVFDWRGGQLLNESSVHPNGGFGFGPRHLDFHPSKPWVYVSLERQNEVAFFERQGNTLAAEPKWRKSTLAQPIGGPGGHGRQMVGTVHVHPNGRFVYVANRASSTADVNARSVFQGGENSIAVFAIDPATGEPTAIQHADTHGIHPRTFHIDPSGRMMAIAHIQGLPMPDGTDMPTRLTTFRIGDDGKLTFVKAYDIETGGKFQWWMGMVAW